MRSPARPTVETVLVGGEPRYEVRIGRGLLAQVELATRRWPARALLTDATVAALHADRLGLEPGTPRVVVPDGEASKSFATLERVLDALATAALDRRSCLIALGGGVVGDLGGLAASLFMRGIDCVQVPTTLLAQVDSSVGGKTAVNLPSGKNLAGTFHPPALVLADTDALATLPEGEYRSGLGEVVKTSLLAGETLLARLEGDVEALRARDAEALAGIVAECVRVKAGVVERDPTERGERQHLNLGHTFAHGIEHAAGYGAVPHGLAVGVGLGLALAASAELGLLEDAGLPSRVARLLGALGLPRTLDELRAAHGARLDAPALVAGMRHDKKGAGGVPRFVLPLAAGRLRRDVAIEEARLERLLAGRG